MNQDPPRPVSDTRRRQLGPSSWLGVSMLAVALVTGCAHHPGPPVGAASPGSPPVTTYEMEPIKITALRGADGGVHVEAYDATELFDQASKALSEKRYDDALASYDRLLQEFQDGRYTRAALYNAGLANQGKKNWEAALARFKALSDRYPDSSDAKDALFQQGATYAEMNNWPASIQVLTQVLERKDLVADDRLEALARRGFAQFQLHDIDTAERTFQSAISYFHQIESQDRLETDFYLALAQYHLGQVSHERFRAVPLRLPERQMSLDLDMKARLLLVSQRQYIDTIKLGNPEWAAASGFQIGSLYEELYDAFVAAPVPPELTHPSARERREVYDAELRKKIRILLEKSVRTHEANLLMMERLGVRTEWREKSKLAFAKLQSLLDPSFQPGQGVAPPGSAPPGTAGSAPPPAPRAPASRPGTGVRPTEEAPGSASPGAVDPITAPPSPPRGPAEAPIRQIL